mmetsp:Transcript_27060/g.28106  ORF Transcript_27060/g.28106 Transcript_27060/m.28106 type:complete len:151 (-) Transcript_27060:97-549(-)
MSDTYFTPPRQLIKECKFLERNYLECLLQKGLKDRVHDPKCNLEYAWYFHVECPDYIKKYDHPVEGKKYLRQQLFHMLSLPYYQYRKQENNVHSTDNVMPTLKNRNQYLEYLEKKAPLVETSTSNLLLNKELAQGFSEGVEFQADPSKDE